MDTSSIRPQLVQNKAICVGLRTSTHMLPRIIDMNGCKWQKKKIITFDYTIGDRQPFLFLRLTKNIYIGQNTHKLYILTVKLHEKITSQNATINI